MTKAQQQYIMFALGGAAVGKLLGINMIAAALLASGAVYASKNMPKLTVGI